MPACSLSSACQQLWYSTPDLDYWWPSLSCSSISRIPILPPGQALSQHRLNRHVQKFGCRGLGTMGTAPGQGARCRGGDTCVFTTEIQTLAWTQHNSALTSTYLNCILSPPLTPDKTVLRFWTSWVSEFLQRGEMEWCGVARHWLPYRWWRELCAELQSGCRQGASLAALGSVWFDSSRWPSQGLPNHHSAQINPRQQQVLEGKPCSPQPRAALCHPRPSKSPPSEPRLRLNTKKELSPRWDC